MAKAWRCWRNERDEAWSVYASKMICARAGGGGDMKKNAYDVRTDGEQIRKKTKKGRKGRKGRKRKGNEIKEEKRKEKMPFIAFAKQASPKRRARI